MNHEPARAAFHLLFAPAAILVAAAIATGCSGGSSDGPDDTPLEPTLDNVLGLFGDSCAGASCHVGFAGEPAAGLDLGPEAACDHLVEIPATEVPT
ncbi:MAG TPA: hypothetical protein VNM90_03895, partial [Haliangium sp.]|nr:hypothetical protein [Haliangium sp.]